VSAVAEQSFFAYVEPLSPAVAESVPAGEAWYEATVVFTGPFGGRLWLAMPGCLARELFAAFLGLDLDAKAELAALSDLIGEFANMTCGTWLTGQHVTKCFALAHPEVREIPPPPLDGTVQLAVNDRPLAVRLETEEPAA
jgi:hypothetical protein